MNKDATLAAGDRVRITNVAFPQHEHHARFIGSTGTVKRIYKTKNLVTVTVDGWKDRECFPHFLEKL